MEAALFMIAGNRALRVDEDRQAPLELLVYVAELAGAFQLVGREAKAAQQQQQ